MLNLFTDREQAESIERRRAPTDAAIRELAPRPAAHGAPAWTQPRRRPDRPTRAANGSNGGE